MGYPNSKIQFTLSQIFQQESYCQQDIVKYKKILDFKIESLILSLKQEQQLNQYIQQTKDFNEQTFQYTNQQTSLNNRRPTTKKSQSAKPTSKKLNYRSSQSQTPINQLIEQKTKKKPFYQYIQNQNEIDKIQSNEINSSQHNEKQDGQSVADNFQEEEKINGNANESTSQIENIQDIKQNQQLQIKIKFEYNKERLQQTVEQIKSLQQKEERNVEEYFKPYLREVGNFYELCKNYTIKTLATKSKLKQICNKIQYVRGDGNCFYYAFMYQFLVHLLITYTVEEYDKFVQFVQDTIDQFQINYHNIKIDDPKLLEEFLYQLQELRLIQNEDERIQQLQSNFIQYNIKEDGQGCFNPLSTIFLRNLSHKLLEIGQNKDLGMDQKDKEQLLEWGLECNYNEIVIQSLAEQLNIHVKLIFFDMGEFTVKDYEANNNNQILLLMKPGHYNIGFLDPNDQ